MKEQVQKNLQELVRALQIQSIQFTEIHSKIFPPSSPPENLEKDVNLCWNQQFADEDPVKISDTELVFRPKYVFQVKNKEDIVFEATMISALIFSVENKDSFEKCWKDEETRKFFLEKQIVRLMWTILRQQLMDCMNRHSFPPIPLPWIV